MNEIKQFERKSKPPSKAELKLMKEQVINQSKPKEDKPMSKQKDKDNKNSKTRKSLSPEDIARLVEEWDNKSTQEWADEFGVKYPTLAKVAKKIREKDSSLCPKKKPKKKTLEENIDAGLSLYKEKRKKK